MLIIRCDAVRRGFDTVQITPRTEIPTRTKILVGDGFEIFRSYRKTCQRGIFEGEIREFGVLRLILYADQCVIG